MIKINLLPAHILERQRVRSVMILVIVIILIEAGVLGLVMMRVKQQLADAKIELEYWKTRAGAVAQVESETQKTQTQAMFYGRWVLWKSSIEKYHEAWAEVLGEIAKWIYAKVQVDSLQPSQTQVQIAGRTTSIESFRKAYLNIIRSPLYSNVAFQISGVGGGWTQAQMAGAAPAARRPGAGAPGGGFRLAFGARRAAAPAPFGGVRRAGGGAFGARPVAGRAAPGVINLLPVGVTFTCALKPEYGMRLNPPVPPVGGAPVAGARGRAAPRGGMRIQMGRPRARTAPGGAGP
jgi:Tfp pilus assembly protein PilN